MRRVGLGVFCGLLVAAAVATSGSGSAARVHEALHAVPRPDKSWRPASSTVLPVPEAVRGQGVVTTGAAAWHKAGGDGFGVKVAVLDLGFDGYRQSQANGDLPTSLVKADFCPPGGFTATSHGTAVAEIVSEMAPGAKLYLICAQSVPALAEAVVYTRAHGIQIISHSVSWLNTSRGDGSGLPGTPERIVAAARSGHPLGERGRQPRAAALERHVHRYERQRLERVRARRRGEHDRRPGRRVHVRGAEVGRLARSAEDYDLYLTRSPGDTVVESSTARQTGTQPPTELVCHVNASGVAETLGVGIRSYRTTSRPARFGLFVYPGPNLEYQTSEGSVTEPGTSPAALTVGAACWTGGLEPYSSRGPTIDGRVKPDLVGPDSVSSFTFGPFRGCASGFAGTSAAAPHVAAAAALVKQANPSFGPDELQAYLESHAVDLGIAGKDPLYGSGSLSLGAAPRLPLRACVVPRLLGRRLSSAQEEVTRAGCRVGRVRRARSRKRSGRVVAQHPRAGKRLAPRGRVDLTLSR